MIRGDDMDMQQLPDQMGMEDMEQGFTAAPMAEEVKINFLDLARDADNSSTTWFDSNVRQTIQSSVNQFYGRHDTGSRYHEAFFKSRSKLFMPKTRSNIRKHEAAAAAAYFSTQDVVQVSAFNDDDKSEKAAADFYKEILNLRLTSSGPRSIDWYQNLIGAYQDTMVNGACVSFQYWDHKNNKPDTRLIPLENFRFDPACDWVNPIESSPYLIEKMPMRVGEIKEKIRKGDFLPVTDEQLAAARRPETNVVSQARNQGRTDPIQRSNMVKEFDIVWVHLNIINQMGIDWCFYTLASDAYLTSPVPLEEMWSHGQRPYVMGKAIIEAHKNYPSSIPQMTKDMQAYQNSIVNQRLDNARLAMDKRYFVKFGSKVDHDSITRNSPGSITMVTDVEKDVKVVSTPDVNPSAYKEQNLLDIAMDDLTGGFNSGTMQSNRSLNETVGGMNLISQSANQVSEYQLKTFSHTWVEPVLRQLLLIEQYNETDETIIQLAASNAQLVKKYQGVTWEDIRMKDLMLTVQVGMGATNPATRLEKFTMAITALANSGPVASQMGLKMDEVIKEVFGALGYKDGARFFDDQVDPQVTALQQQVQQLTQELAQKRNPAVDASQVEINKATAFKIRSEATFANMQSAQVICAMPAVAAVADKVSETNGFMDMQGQNPQYEDGIQGQGSMVGALQHIAAQDPDALIAAHEQANANPLRANTHPILPATGNAGALQGIEGGR